VPIFFTWIEFFFHRLASYRNMYRLEPVLKHAIKSQRLLIRFSSCHPHNLIFSLPLPTLHKHNFGQKRESGQTSVYQIQVNSLHKQANLTANLCRKSISFTTTYPQSCNLNQTESLCLNKIKWAEEISDVWKSLFRSSTKSKEPEVFEHVHTCTEKMLLA